MQAPQAASNTLTMTLNHSKHKNGKVDAASFYLYTKLWQEKKKQTSSSTELWSLGEVQNPNNADTEILTCPMNMIMSVWYAYPCGVPSNWKS